MMFSVTFDPMPAGSALLLSSQGRRRTPPAARTENAMTSSIRTITEA
ncbi:hypothetical protein [Cryobacterium fucosi]|nr:hypothetical protein [Cryobacterium fucosi]